MTVCLKLIQKPPVVFTPYDPARVLDSSDLASAVRRSVCWGDALAWLWLSYGRSVLADVDPCMEANEGADATVTLAARYEGLSQMAVRRMQHGSYELQLGGARLYLTETAAGDVFLYFFSPELRFNRREECRIDLTDFGSDAAAYFIATLFGAFNRVSRYYETHTLH